MRVLYGVVGEGMGHATRVVLQHLVDSGHEVEIMTSGRPKDFLAKHGVKAPPSRCARPCGVAADVTPRTFTVR